MAYSFYYNKFHPYFKRLGLDTIDGGFYDVIKRWEAWYKGNVPGFHVQDVYNGAGEHERRHIRKLNMAKKLCEDIADMLLNERVQITIDGTATHEFVMDVLRRSNFTVKGNEYQERKAATGTVAYVPYLSNVVTDDDGNVVSADVKINYASAANIFPTAWSNGEITECVFAFPLRHRRKTYYLMQQHALEEMDGGGLQYVITNSVLSSGGKDIPRDTWKAFPSLRGVEERMETGSAEPQFAIDRLASVNAESDDNTNPMGAAIFASFTDILAKLDIEYDSYYSEFELGVKRLFVAPEMLKDSEGRPVFDARCRLYYKLPEDFFKASGEAIHEVNMTIRAEEHEQAINQDLNLASLRAGFGTQYYRFEKGGITTATQVISENSDQYRTIKKHEIPLEKALITLFRAIIRLGIASGHEGLDPGASIKIRFDDSIIEDKATERAQDMKDVAMGVMSLVEYRAKWYGETEEVAAKKIPNPIDGTGVMV